MLADMLRRSAAPTFPGDILSSTGSEASARARAVMRLYMPLRMLYMYCTRAVAKLLVVVAGDAR